MKEEGKEILLETLPPRTAVARGRVTAASAHNRDCRNCIVTGGGIGFIASDVCDILQGSTGCWDDDECHGRICSVGQRIERANDRVGIHART